jgi:hypothetical protein
MPFTDVTNLLPDLPPDGATGDDFNNPAIAFWQALRDVFAPALGALADEFAAYVVSTLTATSATSLAIGTGSKAFNVGTGFAFAPGQYLRSASEAAPDVDYMDGTVTSYTGGVLTLSIGVGGNHGSGTHTDWHISPVLQGSLYATLAGVETFTNKRITKRVVAAGATSGTITPNADTTDVFKATGLTGTVTVDAPSGTPTDGQQLMLYLEDDGTTRTTNFNAIFRAEQNVTLPTATTANKHVRVACIYNSTDTKWDVVAVVREA